MRAGMIVTLPANGLGRFTKVEIVLRDGTIVDISEVVSHVQTEVPCDGAVLHRVSIHQGIRPEPAPTVDDPVGDQLDQDAAVRARFLERHGVAP